MKRYLAMLGAAMFFIVCFSLYLMMESVSSNRGYDEMGLHGMMDVEDKIKEIESELQKNRLTIGRIKDTVRSMVEGDKNSLDRLQDILREDGLSDNKDAHGNQNSNLIDRKFPSGIFPSMKMNNSVVNLPSETCEFAARAPQKTDVQMYDVYETVPFSNVDGGAWKQGFPISYAQNTWAEKPLQVFVVPHSHNDPGWLKTFERYYADQTRIIFETMVEKLEAFPKMRFIYAEMSFFSKWWDEISEDKRQRVRKLLAENRLEIVTGGWVMSDEANAHFFAMLDQIIEGNQWLHDNTGVKPVTGWAIDPFGHSPTSAYLLKRSGMQNMLIQRTHYIVKKYLAQHKQLEFRWRQDWDHDGSTDMLCHMMPFYSYDVPHTCGPDPKVCCQFDFKRLPGGKISCPWKVPPVPITPGNVAERAAMLLDQYKKKASLYQNNVLLVPLGDDFRYDKAIEWDQQYHNYQLLFDHINANPTMHTEIRFGTLTDYFDALRKRAGTTNGNLPDNYPTLAGDFFSYADRDDHYWTGYFTSRPFYKCMDRILEDHLRAAEIIYSLALVHSRKSSATGFPAKQCTESLTLARRHLGLFQHHDAITGTAKDFVVVDYGNKLLTSIRQLKRVIIDSAHFLLAEKNPSSYTYSESTPFFDVDETRETHDSLPETTVIRVDSSPRPVVFYNSLTQPRTSVVLVYVSDPQVEVRGQSGSVVLSQVDPVWLTNTDAAPAKFKLSFIASVPALGLATYTIKQVAPGSNKLNVVPTITFHNIPQLTSTSSGPFKFDKGTATEVFIENSQIKASLDTASGMLKHVTLKEDGTRVEAGVEFLTYGVSRNKEKSGAYLFLPDGQAKPVMYDAPLLRVLEGPIVSEVHVFIPTVEHKLRLLNSPGVDGRGLDILNLVDIRGHNNMELVMRIKSEVTAVDGSFYTDLNGFQYIRRKTHSKLPLQANFYPMPTMSYLDNGEMRLSLLSGQSLGVASLQPGCLEVMQDRRLNQDDNRGLGQAVIDNKKTPNRFRLLLERRPQGVKSPPKLTAGYASLLGQLASHDLIYPLHTLPGYAASSAAKPASLTFTPLLPNQLPCDIHMVNMRTLKGGSGTDRTGAVALILRRLGVDCSLSTKSVTCPAPGQKVTLGSMFNDVNMKEAHLSSLSFVHDSESTVDLNAPLNLPVMELEAYKIKFL